MKKLTIGKKLYLAFSIVLLFLLAIGGISIFELGDITDTFDELITSYQKIGDESKDVHISLLTARRHEKDFIARRDKKYIERMDETLNQMTSLLKEMDEICDRLGLETIKKEIARVLEAESSYKIAFGKVTSLILEQGDKSSGMRGNMRKYAHDMEAGIMETGDSPLMIQYLLIRRHEKDFVLREDMKYVKKAQGVVDNLHNILAGIDVEQDLKDSIVGSANSYQAVFKDFADNISTIKKQYPIMSDSAHAIEDSVLKINKEIHDIIYKKEHHALELRDSTIWFLYISCGVILFMGIFLSLFSVRSITKPVNKIIEVLREGAEQVASASDQVSSSSQQLAEGASEQAASIEETSSSLEEMSSMTKQNADNAGQADNLMKEANQVVVQANESMNDLTTSMEEISKASEETSKIIKTIDEIAFQTNLLALNAAVEAARAGEAGAGFAVVADEVRNLAMRAADAAKDTADLIEGTVKKVGDGSELVTKTNDAFLQVTESAKKVGELVGEISAASNEQADGIQQINIAVTEMDKVVQQNAANAEESASASEEMSAQSLNMKGSVGELLALVEGSQNGTGKKSIKPVEQLQHQMNPNKIESHESRQLTVQKEKEINPGKIIPMEDDFQDF